MITTSQKENDKGLIFQVRPRLLTLLGDQLIRDASLAVFELVKNAYDADATKCSVTLEGLEDPEGAEITIQDNGCGMDENVLRNVWMMIATDFRTTQRADQQRTPRFHRFPLGEKGLGRLSIHKLGRLVRLITRTRGGRELEVEFDWDIIETASSLNAAIIKLGRKREPEMFPGNKHGTRLEVTRLRESWTRGELRKLHRAVNSLCSPFQGPTDFEVVLAAPGRDDWLEGLFTFEQADASALYHVKGAFEGASVKFDYSFSPPPGYSRQLRRRTVQGVQFKLERRADRKSVNLDLSSHEIGKVGFEFWLFDRDSTVLRAVTDDIKGLKDYLDENGGIRIYRDGIRVYDFGEPGNDWLNLDIRRVNTPTTRTSNNQILGALQLNAVDSSDLREKTNREGFIENSAFADFRAAVISVLTQVEAEKVKDQRRLREVLGKGTGKKVFEKLTELRDILEDKGVLKEVEPKLKAAEKEMELYRDQLLHAAVPGLTIGVMLHGAEKILDELRAAASRGATAERIKELVERLYRAMRPVTNLLKNPSLAKTSASVLIQEAIFSTELRLRRHNIKLINGLSDGTPDFKIRGSKQMLIASITNLIDNSIHWLEIKSPKEKLLYIGTTSDLEGGAAIVIADNGPGFGTDDPEDLVAPFFTRRTGGMGLGLYIVNEVMRVSNGSLIFPGKGDVNLPPKVDGAIVALQFETSR
ncbi:MAG: sensor histidine kinase [Alphaproteobacteria bacterium]|nr:sensor histidine kinase [Alphaproteobacteria bacterium]